MELENFINENLLYGRALVDLEISNKGSNPLWTGFVATNQGEFPAYIKKCRNAEGLCIEIISALIGLMLDIPIPKPMLVLVEPNHPQIAVDKPTLLFGSQMYDMPSFERFLMDHELSEECLLDFSGLHSIVAFDELIANPDRNNSNILYDGDSFRFIDHEKAFFSSQDPRLPINEITKVGNISEIIQHYKGENEIYTFKLMSKIKKCIADEMWGTNCDSLAKKAQNHYLLNEYNTIIERVRNFLNARNGVLAILIENAIKPPQSHQQLDLIGG
ncbi:MULTISPECIES: HipA family kinase [Acinetobacter]|uniref:HipA-like kinase domain-containing protein n=1 Tax=Acinetobacter ursingii TaxID=108980 RepID=A0A3D2SJZ9_9GAMM|nr:MULTISPECIES: HipA family kinase [Acinetobacter]ENV76231.1 hypothetical protein F944_01702 [Acinetobacter ursingii DSM 16037 = CIP 107286]MCH2004074.1 hypothetical protein [Acinetobacter ursingii]MPW44835.1 hypothetical protein [Acinetobacter guerrae]QQT67261.1 hypothetical protein I6I52_06425 [Acinetobacter ursingii]HCK29122.1 hypothetical protein [Acinetobacter ursingii]